ncbi:Glycosyltransferase [[Clostridium] ultunense Esp]|nr:Glycosyltransferase [[Clostridium] ultunense Esp]
MDQRVKIIHIIGGGEFGGAEQHILSLLEQIEKNQSYDTEVVTFYEGLLAKRLRERGDPVTVLPQSGRFDLKLYSRLVRLFRQKKPSIIHTHGVRANFFSRLGGKKAGVPHIVTTVHSILKHDYPKPAEYLVAKWMEKLTLSFSERYIAVSDAVKEDLIHFGVPLDHITVIHNGIHTESYAPGPALSQERERWRHEWGIPPESFLLLTVARLVPVKGIEDLIEGFAIAFANDPSLRLLIVGDGPERKSLERLAMEKKVSDQVLFAGFRQDIPALLAASDLYLNTSLSEGLPLSLMEAMAAEKPVIATQVGE